MSFLAQFIFYTTMMTLRGASQEPFVYNHVAESVRNGASFAEALAFHGVFQREELEYPQNTQRPIWQENQCKVVGESVMKRCSCFEILNMAHLWLMRARVPTEEYRQLQRMATKLHHPDLKDGAAERFGFLKRCVGLVCGDEKCLSKMTREQTKQKRKYIQHMELIWQKCSNHFRRRGSAASAECYRGEVAILNQEIFGDNSRPRI